jgi:VIT1/CCC1 family predicted Fe2+/Mn2+ transporter
MIRFNLSASNNPLFIGFYRNFYNPKKGSLSDFLSQYSKSKPGNFTVVQIGANDGIISIACLILGVAAADASRSAILTAGMAGLVAGAASMGLGEYVSVSSQKDVERANIAKETWELEHMPEHELDELTEIFMAKGIERDLARSVAVQLTEKDALKVHLAEELGITEINRARPIQAGMDKAASATASAGNSRRSPAPRSAQTAATGCNAQETP